MELYRRVAFILIRAVESPNNIGYVTQFTVRLTDPNLPPSLTVAPSKYELGTLTKTVFNLTNRP